MILIYLLLALSLVFCLIPSVKVIWVYAVAGLSLLLAICVFSRYFLPLYGVNL